jgi:hypothetical protein
VIFHKPAHAVVASRFLVGNGRENNRTAEFHTFPEQQFQRQHKHDAQTLGVQCAAPPDKAVGHFTAEGRMTPLGRIGGNYIHVVIDHQRF